MINANGLLEIKAMAYTTQLDCNKYKYYNAVFCVIPVRLKTMYLNKYDTKCYYTCQQPFDVVAC